MPSPQATRKNTFNPQLEILEDRMAPAVISISTTNAMMATGTVGDSYHQSIMATGGTAPYSFTVSAGTLPAGLTLSSSGVLSGVLTSTVSNPFTVQATDTKGDTAGTQSYTLSIDSAITFSPTSLPAADVSSVYSQTLSATGGSGSGYTYAVISGSLPGWMSLNANTGALTGTPLNATGSPFSFTMLATDSNGATGSQSYSVKVDPALSIAPNSPLPVATAGDAYSQTITASGGSGSGYTYAVTAGSLPGWMTLDASTGALTGTPLDTSGSPFSFTITATDSNSDTISKAYALTVDAAVVVSPSSSALTATAGDLFNQTISATGGSGAGYTFAVTTGSLPSWLTLNAGTGVLSGTPADTSGSPFNFTITATDSKSGTGSQAYTLTVDAAIVVSPSTSALTAAVGNNFDQTISATGGAGSGYTFSVTAGSLPGWLTLTAATGDLNGTPLNQTGSPFSFTITATDSSGGTGSQAYTLTVNKAITISPTGALTATLGDTFNQTLTASGGSGTGYSYSIISGTTPGWLSLDASTGALSGTPTAGGPYTFTILATDSLNDAGTQSYTLTVDPAITIGPGSLPTATVNDTYSQALTASGGSGTGYTYAVTSGSLPTGLTLSSAGVLSGTSTDNSGTPYSFTVTATDSLGGTGSQAYSLVVDSAITVSPTSSALTATVGDTFDQNITASGGSGSGYTFAVTSGSLPAWMTLNGATGELKGTPLNTTGSPFSFTITATDSIGGMGSQAYNLTVDPAITISPTGGLTATVNSNFNQSLTASGGTGSGYTYSIISGTTPGWLSLDNSTGAFSGTPTDQTGSPFSFTVLATDSAGGTGTQSYMLTVDLAITLSTPTLATATVGNSYPVTTLTASGGSGSGYTFAITSGALPTGMSLDSSGDISGTPTDNSGSPYNFTVTATDSANGTGSQAYTLTVDPAIVLGASPLPAATVGDSFDQFVSASGGSGSGYTYAVTSGSLPGWLGLNTSTGELSGTPSDTTGSPFSFTITATDSLSATGSQAYTLTVDPAITISPTTLATATVGDSYPATTLTASGGSGSGYIYLVTAGGLPAGMKLDIFTGVLSGTPTDNSGSPYSFTVTADDDAGGTGSQGYSLTVDPAITLGPTTLPTATVGNSYPATTLSASGGSGSGYTFAITSGALPAGMSMDNAGDISGAPTDNSGSPYSFTVTATDSNNATGSQAYSLTVESAITLSMPALPTATVGDSYPVTTLTASGGSGTGYTFAITSGALPPGMNLDISGDISGTPTDNSGSPYSFTVTATDSDGGMGSQAYSLTVDPAITLSPTTLPTATVGTAYSQTLTASGGSGSGYTFAGTAGSLPDGLTLSAAGVLSGTPTDNSGNPYSFTITATDDSGATGSQDYTLTVNPPVVVTPVSGVLTATIGNNYFKTIGASGGSGTGFTFAVTSGSLPGWLNLSSTTGVLNGTPAAGGPFSFTITATDSDGDMGSQAFTLTVDPAIVVSPSSGAFEAVLGTTFSQALSASGGSGTGYTFAVTGGSLPPWLFLSSGTLTGTPAAGGPFNFTISATDSAGGTGSQAYTLTVDTAITLSPTTLPTATVNTAYSQTLTASGGSGTGYTYAVTSGSLPDGLFLDPNLGTLSGSPTDNDGNPYSFTVTATDSGGGTGSQDYTLTVDPAITLSPTTLPLATVGASYSQTLTPSGGSGNSYTFAVTSGNLPDGMSLDPNLGILGGTPTDNTGNPYSFTVTATDDQGGTGSQAYTLNVDNAITLSPTTLPDAVVGSSYYPLTPVTLTASGGDGSGVFTYAVTQGSLPDGMTLDPNLGTLSGTPTDNNGTPYSFTVTATDELGGTGSQDYTLNVDDAVAVTPATSTLGATINNPFNLTLGATGGTGTGYTFAVTNGSLPAWMALDPNLGTLSGTPTDASGSPFDFTITATDDGGNTGSQDYTLTVLPTLSLAAATLPDAAVGSSYSPQTLMASGGSGSGYTFAVTAGSIPDGMTLDPNLGTLGGTPTDNSGNPYSFTVTVTDDANDTANQSYTLNVDPAITLSPATLPDAALGGAYSQTIAATGGSGSGYTYALTSGTLPIGLSVDPNTGILGGTPTDNSGNPYNFTISATDSNGNTGSQGYTLTVDPAITLSPTTLPAATVGISYSQQLTASGGSGSGYTYAVTAGTLPNGLSLDPNLGILGGIPTDTATTYNFTVTATDSNGATGSQDYSLTLQAGVAVGFVFVQAPPSSVLAGSTIPPMIVQLVDAGGNAVAQDGVSAQLNISGVSTPIVATTNSAGQATFSNVSISSTGSQTLTFSAPALPDFNSLTASITVTSSRHVLIR